MKDERYSKCLSTPEKERRDFGRSCEREIKPKTNLR